MGVSVCDRCCCGRRDRGVGNKCRWFPKCRWFLKTLSALLSCDIQKKSRAMASTKAWEPKCLSSNSGSDLPTLCSWPIMPRCLSFLICRMGVIRISNMKACCWFSSVQQLSNVQLFARTLLMACSMPGFPVHHQLLELTHVHRVSDAIQPSHPLSSSSPPTFNLSQHQVLFQWVSSLHQVAKVLEFQLQHQSFQWIFRIDFL